MEDKPKNKTQPRIYEDQTRLEQFMEPDLMRFLTEKFKKIQLNNSTIIKTPNIMAKAS